MKTYTTLFVALLLLATDAMAQQPVRFDVSIQNAGSAFSVLKSGAVLSPGGPDAGGAIFPGETATFSFPRRRTPCRAQACA